MQADSENTTNNSEIPYGFCHCGCGQKTKISPKTDCKRGLIKGQPRRFLFNHHRRFQNMEHHPKWQGGFKITEHGYKMVLCKDHPRANSSGYVFEHILIAEKALGKRLPLKAKIHHHGRNKSKNSGNLIICEDQAYHHLIEQRTRAWEACGNANWLKCAYCHEYDDPAKLKIHKAPRSPNWHPECKTEYDKTYNANKKLKIMPPASSLLTTSAE